MLQIKKFTYVWCILFVVLAYIFSVGVRYYYVDTLDDAQNLKVNNTLIINTNDGFYFAEGAKEILKQTHPKEINQTKILSQDTFESQAPVTQPLSLITAFLIKILPFSIEQIILYMPGFIASLVVLPIFFLARSVNPTFSGNVAAFLSASIGGIAVSYYNRTMFGYYDTDMFIIVFAMLIGALIFFGTKEGDALKEEKSPQLNYKHFLMLSSMPILTYMALWYYPSLRYVLYGYFFILLVYNLFVDRRNYFLQALSSIYGFSILFITAFNSLNLATLFEDSTSTAFDFSSVYLHATSLIILFVISSIYTRFLKSYATSGVLNFTFKKPHTINFQLFIFFCVAIIFIFFIGIDTFSAIFSSAYVAKQSVDVSAAYFFGTINTVAEVGAISFETFARRISGSTLMFILSGIGIIALVFKDKKFLIFAPMLFLGYFAYFKGLRYTIYAVPIHALGLAGLVVLGKILIQRFSDKLSSPKILASLQIILICLVGALSLKPNLEHIKSYISSPVFNNSEVDSLLHLGKIAKRGDYVLAWWDYGYPIRYYSGLNTFTDGGMHDGERNYHVSLALTHKDANVARNTINLLSMGSNIIDLSKIYRLENTQDLHTFLSYPLRYIKNPRHDTYVFLPFRMLSIFTTVSLFSNINLESGTMDTRKLFAVADKYQETNDMIKIGDNMTLNKKTLEFTYENTKTQAHSLIIVSTNDKYKNQISQVAQGNKDSKIAVVYLRNYRKFLIMHTDYLSSLYIRGFMFENLDPNLYESVFSNGWVKIYKVKP